MTLLERIHTGRRHSPPRLVLYGTEGIGKSTTAAAAPEPIFIPTEDGLDQIDCASFPLAGRYSDVEAALQALIHEPHDFQTVVIDSLDWLERLIWDHLCQQYGVTGIEKVDGGYARGYTHALTHWRKVLADLDTLRRKRGMCVILLAHAKVEKFEDPEHSSYDRYSPRLHKHANALITEWADAVLFATRRIITRADASGGGFGRDRTIAAGLGEAGGERILRTVGSPSCVAKNRFNLPGELPLAWSSLMEALRVGQQASAADNPPPLRLTNPAPEPATAKQSQVAEAPAAPESPDPPVRPTFHA